MIKTKQGETTISGLVEETLCDLTMIVRALKQHMTEDLIEDITEEEVNKILIEHISLGLMSNNELNEWIHKSTNDIDIDSLMESINDATDKLYN